MRLEAAGRHFTRHTFRPPTSQRTTFHGFYRFMMLTYYFRLCLAVTGLTLIDASVSAEWVALEDHHQFHPLQTVYIDRTTVHREGHVVVLSALVDWKAMQGGRTPARFFSTTLTKHVDCAEKLVRTVAAADFYGRMGTGEMIGGGGPLDEGHWAAVEPGTINEGVWAFACGKG